MSTWRYNTGDHHRRLHIYENLSSYLVLFQHNFSVYNILTPWSRVLFHKLIVAQIVKNSSLFIETGCPVMWQQHATGHYHEDESSLHPDILYKIFLMLSFRPHTFHNLQHTITAKGRYSCPAIRHKGAWEERRYSSYSFPTSSLDGGEWSALRPGRALAPGKGPPVLIVQEAGWAPEPVWTRGIEERSLFASAGDRALIARSSSLQPDTILTELPQLLITCIPTYKFSVDDTSSISTQS
jgi:hypothetical protein